MFATITTIMDYELAKALKDAGFPLTVGRVIQGIGATIDDDNGGVYVPTLSELIEACGREGFKLKHAQAGWCAQLGPVMEAYCPTPEEAVAWLWLALNTPKKP